MHFNNKNGPLLLILVSLILIEPKERNDFMFSNFECESNNKYVKIVLCRLNALRGQVPDLRVIAQILLTVHRAEVTIQMYKKYNYYQKFPISFKVDGCKALGSKKLNPFIAIVRDYIINQSNISRSCPVYPSTVLFSTAQKPVNFSKLLPSIFPKGLFRMDIQFQDKKVQEQILLLKAYMINRDNF